MRRYVRIGKSVAVTGVLSVAMIAGGPAQLFAQAQPPQLTNDDLLRLIGLQQVQNLQCGKSLEAVQRELQGLKEQKEKPKGDDSSAH